MSFENLNTYSLIIVSILIIAFVYLIYKNYKYKKENYKKIKNIVKNVELGVSKYVILFISFLLISISILQPKGFEKQIKIKNKGVDIMFVLDVSKSMNTADIQYGNYKTTRLELAKKAISNYIVKHPENRYGLVIFAGDAIASIPLTSDKEIFNTLLQGVDYKNLTKQGSNFSKAIQLAIDRFNQDNRGKVLVFLSDGGDNGDYKGLGFKFPKDIKSIVIGIGSKLGGKIILGQDVFGNYKYQTYKGQYVITKLNEENLKKLAEDINGKYIYLDNIDKLDKIDNYIKNIERKAINEVNSNEKLDLTRYFIIIAFIIFIVYLLYYEIGILKNNKK